MAVSYIGEDIEKILGREFLTWLWFRSENAASFFMEDIEYCISTEKRITVAFGEGSSAEMASAGGPASQLLEAKLGLAEGKTVVRATYSIEHAHARWTFSLKASDFSLSSIKAPAIDTEGKQEGDEDAIFLERLSYLEEVLEAFTVLYRTFLTLRIDSVVWEKEVQAIREWIQNSLR